jgi:hypothetical protein
MRQVDNRGQGQPGYDDRQVISNAFISLRMGQMIRYQGRIDLMQLVRAQTVMTLEGEESDIDPRLQRTPIFLQSYDQVSYGLDLLIRGNA